MNKNIVIILVLAGAVIGGFFFFSGNNEPKPADPGSPKLNAQELLQHKGLTAHHPKEKGEAAQAQADTSAKPEAASEDDQVAKNAVAMRDGCLLNLRAIEDAKTKWAIANNKIGGDKVSLNDIMSYLPNSVLPPCPAGGAYSLNEIGVNPTCNVNGHSIPLQ